MKSVGKGKYKVDVSTTTKEGKRKRITRVESRKKNVNDLERQLISEISNPTESSDIQSIKRLNFEDAVSIYLDSVDLESKKSIIRRREDVFGDHTTP